MFIVLEGIDGAGTTTQARRIADYLADHHLKTSSQPSCIVETYEPSDLAIGRLIRERLKATFNDSNNDQGTNEGDGRIEEACNALLFAADRLSHLNKRILPALRRGDIVVCDRYLYSSLAYQSISLPLDWVSTLNTYARQPDLCFYLRAKPDEAKLRREVRGSNPERYDNSVLQQRIAQRYDDMFITNKLSNKVSGRSVIDLKKLHVVDANATIDGVFSNIQSILNVSLKTV